MRISNVQLFNRGIDSIMVAQQNVSKIYEQISSGKRIQTPADDPIGSAQGILLHQQVDVSERFQENNNLAENRLTQINDILGSVVNVMQRIRELAIQGNNDALSLEDKQTIILELSERQNELLGLVNTRDSNGDFIFSGNQIATEPFSKNSSGAYVYNGDDGQRFLEIATGFKIAVTDSGFDLFADIASGNGFFSVQDGGVANTGTGVVGVTGVSSPSNYIPDTYTLTFVTNGAGDLAYQVIGATSGQVVPALPAVIPTDAPAFISGQKISFNGVELDITGIPQVGDDFVISPSQGQNIFTTIDKLITSLGLPTKTAANRAAVQNNINRNLEEIDMGLNNIILYWTRTGARMNAIDSARELNADFIFQGQVGLSKLENVDYAQAMTEYEAVATSLEIAQKSFVRIRDLNLFNFIR